MLSVKHLKKTYKPKKGAVTKALDDVSIDFPETGMIFLLGRSGSGKSTLLNMIGGLDRPDSGEVIVKGKSSKDFTNQDFDSYRNTFIGFIFQEYNILNEFNVEQNIALALQLQGKKADKAAISKLLKEVDLNGLERRKPNTLSGGQKQRIAIARALIKEPQIIMADEPTGALDSNTGKQVFDTLKKLSQTKLVIIVSHDREFAQQYGDRIIELKDGKIISDESKIYKKATKLSPNVNVITKNVLQISNANKITAKDSKAIIKALKDHKGEVIISTGTSETTNVRKALKIAENNSSTSFDTTKKVEVKKYDGSQTKFIKSRMPFSRAFKMGASGLKVKPFRLIMTILLSTVAFAMFGIVSTLMLYNPTYSVREAMKTVDYKTETISKKYKYQMQNIKVDYATGKETIDNTSSPAFSPTPFTTSELEELNNNSAGLKFAGLFDFSGSYNSTQSFSISSLNVTGENKDFFNSQITSLNGFSDCGDEYMKSQGYTMCNNGSYPDDINEIAISNYIAYAILDGNVFPDQHYLYPSDLVGKTISVSGSTATSYSLSETFTITGVYHIADIPNTYDSLKLPRNTSTQSEQDRAKLIESMSRFINGGFFRTGFVSEGFYEAHKNLVTKPTIESYVPTINLKGVRINNSYPSSEDVGPETWENVYDYDYVKNYGNFSYYDIKTENPVQPSDIRLADGDAIISKSTYNGLIRTDIGKYGIVKKQFENMYNSVCSNDHYPETMQQNVSDVYDEHYNHFSNQLNGWEQTFDSQFYDDYHAIKECLDDYYKDAEFIRFASNYLSPSDIETEYPEIKDDPTIWAPAKESLNKLNNWEYPIQRITDTDISNINEFINFYVDKSKLLNSVKIPLFKYIGENVCAAANSQFSDKINSDGGYSNLVQNLSSSNLEEFINETQNYYYPLLYGKNIDLKNQASYYPADRGTFSPYYDYKAYYFYKTGSGDSTIKTFNVNYYYDDSNNNSTTIVSHNFAKNYIADTNVWFNNIVTNYEIPANTKYNKLMTKTTYSDQEIKVMWQDFSNKGFIYEMNNATYQQISIMIDLVNQFKQIFLYIGIGTGALSALLLANFISASINNKKKDIGILRAVGAKGGDVFKVFWSESGIIALICFVLATVSAALTCNALNGVIVGTIISIKVLNFSVVNILIILGASILISLLATLFPVLHAAKKPPVEAIRSL